MSVPYALLGLLEPAPRHGYELKREYDSLFNFAKPVKFGQVYSTLARLQRDGLVDVQTEEPGRGPDRKLYAITPEGVADLDEWLREPEPAEPYIQSVLFAKVVLALASGRDAAAFLESQRAQHLERMRGLTRLKTSGDLADEVVADYALAHLEADLRWIELTAARLDRLSKEIGA
ncbi:MAG: PadR family transcriptional regulator [Actinomycetota bacterium]|nr:PadR family transcriptional regulator [Actinomycetota bacterium]